MKEIGKLITPRVLQYYKVDQDSSYNVEFVDPKKLISPYRIDVLIKLFYIEAKVKGLNMDFAKELYVRHVHSITEFKDSENGQKEKNSISSFLNTFDDLITSFQSKGFDDSLSIIPVSNDNIILDGAHRLSCCIFFNIPVRVVRLAHVGISCTIKPPIYDEAFFRRYLLPPEYLDLAALQFLKYSTGEVFMACLWPVTSDCAQRDKAIGAIRRKYPIIYTKSITLTFRAFDRLVAQVYMHDDWVGNIKNNFSGSRGKSKLTYKEGNETTFVLFKGDSTEKTLLLKDEIREIFNIGKHSIHITDNTEQSLFLANIVFNSNSLNLLEYANTGKYCEEIEHIYLENYTTILNLDASRAIWGIEHDSNNIKPLSKTDLT